MARERKREREMEREKGGKASPQNNAAKPSGSRSDRQNAPHLLTLVHQSYRAANIELFIGLARF